MRAYLPRRPRCLFYAPVAFLNITLRLLAGALHYGWAFHRLTTCRICALRVERKARHSFNVAGGRRCARRWTTLLWRYRFDAHRARWDVPGVVRFVDQFVVLLRVLLPAGILFSAVYTGYSIYTTCRICADELFWRAAPQRPLLPSTRLPPGCLCRGDNSGSRFWRAEKRKKGRTKWRKGMRAWNVEEDVAEQKEEKRMRSRHGGERT